MDKIASNSLLGEITAKSEPKNRNQAVTEAEGAGLRELYALLSVIDPENRWGNLKRVLAPTGEYLWLCPDHYKIYEPGLPFLSESS